MTNMRSNVSQRRFPGFLDEWREVNGEDFTPISYLNQPDGLSFVIAAQWLFAPDFAEYRSGIFRTELPRGLSENDRKVLDDWHTEFNGDVPKVEKIANLLTFNDAFTACDLAPYEEDLPQLARAVARSWDAQLRVEFPDRVFQVEVYDDAASYGPQVTFFQGA
jgi:hypothetical protein